jgi:YesN/AraC family two-component response regulator
MTCLANPAHSNTILFVEDNEVILELQVSVLTARFPDVIIHTATNGKQGVELFIMHHHDIVITDINMSEMCGVQMATNIRALKQDTQFIAITGKDSSEIRFEFDHYIVKPVGFEALFAAIEKCIGGMAIK